VPPAAQGILITGSLLSREHLDGKVWAQPPHSPNLYQVPLEEQEMPTLAKDHLPGCL
jgi:hypothetical protein